MDSLKNIVMKLQSPALPDSRAHMIFWPLFAGGLALDLWTKKAVFDWLEYGESFTVIRGVVRLVEALNDGAAFGTFPGKAFFLTLISVVAILVVLGVFFLGGARQRLVHVALGLFAAGICGNLYDRLFNEGLVRDFIDVVYWPGRHWPTFNVADSALCVGVGLLILSTVTIPKSDQKRARQQR